MSHINFVMVSSLIKITDAPLTYSKIRSVYSHEERFEQTLKTIESVRKYIPNATICLVDCSQFTENEENILHSSCDYVLNLYDTQLRNTLRYSNSKSQCEGLQTLVVIQFIKQNNITFNNFFKITGRYTLNEQFDYSIFNRDMNVGRIQPDMTTYFLTSFYKLTPSAVHNLYNLFRSDIIQQAFKHGVAYEECFLFFVKTEPNTLYLDKAIGIDEFLSVNGAHRSM